MAKVKDQYANVARLVVTESAANTITFNELHTGVPLFEKVAWVVNRIEYFVGRGELVKLVDSGDAIYLGITQSDQLTDLGTSLDEAGLIDLTILNLIYNTDGGSLNVGPYVKDFSSMPGGGIIITPTPLYLAIQGVSLASAVYAQARIYFQYKSLQPSEYWELVESRRIVT